MIDRDYIVDLLSAEPGTPRVSLFMPTHRSGPETRQDPICFKNLLGEAESELATIKLDMPESTVQDRLTQAVLECVASEKLSSGSTVVAVYSSFHSESIDTVSILKLTERLVRLTARDLKKLETKVPLETLKIVVDLAVTIGKEGREGKPIGTMFVVGDHRKVLEHSRPGGFDAMKGYTRKERNLNDNKVREGIKELAQLDGMFVVAAPFFRR